MRPFLRFLATPPGRTFHLFCGALALLSCHNNAFLGYVNRDWASYLALTVALLIPLWCLRLLAFVAVSPFYENELPKSSWKVWLVAPALLVFTTWMVIARYPFQVAFAFSKPLMRQLAREASPLPNGATLPPRRVGYYYASNIVKIDHVLYFSVSQNREPLNKYYFGFSYSPNRKQTPTHKELIDPFPAEIPIGDGWYYTVRRWLYTAAEKRELMRMKIE